MDPCVALAIGKSVIYVTIDKVSVGSMKDLDSAIIYRGSS